MEILRTVLELAILLGVFVNQKLSQALIKK